MSLEVFASAISQMAEPCPVSGSVTATLTVHDRNVYLKSVVTAVASDSSADRTKIEAFKSDFTDLYLYDLNRLRVFYGEIIFVVNVKDGTLTDYSCIPVIKWNASKAL